MRKLSVNLATARMGITAMLLALVFVAVPARAQDHSGHNHGPMTLPTLPPEDAARAEADYQRYCALCHGSDRAGGANDHAPSLKSKSLFASGSPFVILTTINYGRAGTPMGGYLDEVGGPLSLGDIQRLFLWLYQKSGAELQQISYETIDGNIENGRTLYDKNCTTCHGTRGEGKIGPALGNPAMLAISPDAFLRYAIEHGRDGTEMKAYKDVLTDAEMDDLTAFLRSRASGWQVETPVLQKPPAPEDYAINPYGPEPKFPLKDGRYVMADDLEKAINNGERMILLDTRVTSQWQTAHIKGAVPLPYYSNINILPYLPRDTWIVSYCECPRAAAESVAGQLYRQGYTKVAVLYEGVYGWVSMGKPVVQGEIAKPIH